MDTYDSPPGDNIQMLQRNTTAATSDETDDVEVADANASQDEGVEEYDFRNETESEDEEDDDENDTNLHKKFQDVITISSDSERDEEYAGWDLTERPWKAFNLDTRRQYEQMYCHLTDRALDGDWEKTEEYQFQKDQEMQRYLEDFPLQQWVIDQQQAQEGYDLLLGRMRWRNLGIRIYNNELISQGVPGSARLPNMQAQAMRMHTPLNVPSSTFEQHSTSTPPQMQQQMPRGSMPPNMSQHANMPPGVQQLPPNRVLPSQPNAQPMQVYPNGMPVYQTTGTPGIVGGGMSNTTMHAGGMYPPPTHQMPPVARRNKRNKYKDVDAPSTEPTLHPVRRPPTPPYETREKPAERKTVNKTGRQNKRRQADAAEYPWNRNIDFRKAREDATWDDSIYDQATLDAMSATRSRNEVHMEKRDAAENERQRQTRLAKKHAAKEDASSDVEGSKRQPRRKKSTGPESSMGDLQNSAHFMLATGEVEKKAATLGKKTIDDIIFAAVGGEIDLDFCGQIIISWNPGKTPHIEELEQAQFSIKDTVLTRRQLAKTPILTRRAAECIIDFCPDMLFREMLLRITSEAGYGNKDVRTRMCYNGNYVDRATPTKRIGAALGQKQQQSTTTKGKKKQVEGEPPQEKIKGYAQGEDDYYNMNVTDFGNYVEYFGKRSSHRSKLDLQRKRKFGGLDGSDDVSGDSGADDKGAHLPKRTRELTTEETQSPDGMDTSGDDGEEATGAEGESDSVHESGDGVGNSDAVSIQSDTVLDQMDED